MTIFTDAELEYLHGERRLARIATVGPDGVPHVTPVGWRLDPDEGVVEIGGINLAATKKFRDVARTRKAALVIDDVLPPWQPRGVEIRGRAEAIDGPEPRIRIHAERIIGWGLDDPRLGRHNARDVQNASARG
jgi:pyridoxamine 5'-phosphate oxidase family protein